MTRFHKVLIAVNILLLVGFGFAFMQRGNTEFMIYIGVTTFFLLVVGATLRNVGYSRGTLIGLTIWSAMHLAGGGIVVGEGRLYDVMLFPLTDALPIFRYDQLVHIIGFGAATLLMHALIAGSLRPEARNPISLSIVVVMAGLGVGALNEIIEFSVSLLLEDNGVGGYVNTSLDLVADLIGAVLAMGYILLMERNVTGHR